MASNTKEISRKGFTYVVTRRIIQRRNSTVLRVRVRVWKGLLPMGNPLENQYKDYSSLAEGDAVYNRHIDKLQGM